MRRMIAIFLACWFVALGSGGLAALHDLQHHLEDAATAAADRAAGRPDKDPPQHDESNCPIHAQLHIPLIAAGWIPLLVRVGPSIPLFPLLAVPQISSPTY